MPVAKRVCELAKGPVCISRHILSASRKKKQWVHPFVLSVYRKPRLPFDRLLKPAFLVHFYFVKDVATLTATRNRWKKPNFFQGE